jgi:NAD-dependent SIR2 family protein deacetylase
VWYLYQGQVIGGYETIKWRMLKLFHQLQASGYSKRKYIGGILMEAYCMKCRAKREMKNTRAVTMKNGKPGTQGVCPRCGTRMFRIGKA